MEVVEAVEVIKTAEVLRPGKSLLRTSESSRFLNSALFCYFEKKIFLLESGYVLLNFSTFFVGGCWGQPMLHFWKLVDETQMPKPQEYIRYLHFDQKAVYSWPQRSSKYVKSNRKTLYLFGIPEYFKCLSGQNYIRLLEEFCVYLLFWPEFRS